MEKKVRRYTELDDQEILSLTDDDIESYVKVEMAYEGVQILELVSLFGETQDYTMVDESIDTIRYKITDYRGKIVKNHNIVKALHMAYEEYLSIACGDKTLAYSFLERSYNKFLTQFPVVKKEIISMVEEPSPSGSESNTISCA